MKTTIASTRTFAVGPAWLAVPLVAAALVGVATPARSESAFCAEHRTLSRFLSDRHAETPVGVGLANNGGLVQVYTSPEGNTWTIFMTMPDGTACLMAAGENWEKFDTALLGPKT